MGIDWKETMVSLKRIGSTLILFLGLNAFVDTFFSFERGNFTVRLVPYAFKSFQLFLMTTVVVYFLGQRTLRIKVEPLFWLLFLFTGDIVVSTLYADDTVNPTDLARTVFWVLAALAVYFLRQADCLDEKLLYRMVVFNFFWVCLRITAYKLFNIWIGAEVNSDAIGEFTKDGVVNNLGYSLVWLAPLYLAFESKHRFPILLAVFFSMLASFKRGALLGLIFGFLAYYVLNRRVKGRNRGSIVPDLLRASLILALAAGAFFLFKDYILYRMADIDGDKSFGSGRATFYQIVLDHWDNFVGTKKMIGAGFFQVMPMLGLYWEAAIPAHSDWLETLYDQGILGVSILASIHLLLLAKVWRAIQQRASYGPQLAYTYVIFFLTSVYSISLYSFDTAWFGVSLGYYLGTDVLEKRRLPAAESVETSDENSPPLASPEVASKAP